MEETPRSAPGPASGFVALPAADFANLRLTYDHLRWTLIGLPILLFCVTLTIGLWKALTTGPWKDSFPSSISAYYSGSSRDVFVGVMIAIAACLIAYRGTTALEEFSLNMAGFFAVFVALIPTTLESVMKQLRDLGERPVGGFSAADYGWSLRITVFWVVIICAVLAFLTLRRSHRTAEMFARGGWGRRFMVAAVLLTAVFLALLVWQLYFAGSAAYVELDGLGGPAKLHNYAAIVMILLLAVAVWSHAYPDRAAKGDPTAEPHDPDLLYLYKWIFLAMTVGVVLVGVLVRLLTPDHWVLAIEWWEIGCFAFFWFVETRRAARRRRKLGQASAAPAIEGSPTVQAAPMVTL
ncbi:hypothetical protein [Ornithinimicrobium cryptoxanthini]|uniref:Uncharacterized protein n=1 Tax=Ornithinimicrobium cryptoxanthini TaxID=2934161 RepID=A0ABY4YH44_9MICO|nr:hypothetical protein [Ornithinimicrobium cryptoxanthini]USQ76081.1 hypothetical protein NF557_16040 [Ornithinimicrobium cryptoxanthini]